MTANAALSDIAFSLLRDTQASRTTIRLCDGKATLIAEALTKDVVSMQSRPVTGVVEAPTYRYLEENHTLLVQNDCRNDEVAPPRSLIEVFRVYAQMLAPVVVDGKMIATISVHQQDEPRLWSKEDVAALSSAQTEVQRCLDHPSVEQ